MYIISMRHTHIEYDNEGRKFIVPNSRYVERGATDRRPVKVFTARHNAISRERKEA